MTNPDSRSDRQSASESKTDPATPFGIRVGMPANDPLAAAHLLGESWNTERWFSTEAERDRVLAGMQKQPPYYRQGDSPSVILEKIKR